MTDQIILNMLEFLNQTKFQHWNTFSYSEHKSLGKLYDALSEEIDTFVETLMGKYGKPYYQDSFQLEFIKPENVDPMQMLNDFSDYLIGLTSEFDSIQDMDLLNQLASILGLISQTKYLLTLK